MSVLIRLKRGGCFGPCPIYKVRIHGNGTVIYQGEEFVRIKGTHKVKISLEKIKLLISEFEKTNFFQLKDRYMDIDTTCQPTVTTSITINGKTKTIIHNYGDLSAPEKLIKLEDKIDEIINTNQWIE